MKNRSKESLLHLQNLLFQRDWQVVLQNVNLEVQAGQWIILRGNNGCGKTTLLKLCVGLLTPTAGNIVVAGTYSYLGHTNGIKPTQTLNGILKSLGDKSLKQSATCLLSSLVLENYAAVPFHQLSAGLKRRVALVQLFTPCVDLYIIDEPMGNLDPYSCQLVWQVLAEKIQAGAAVFMTHHGPILLPHPAIQEIFLDA